MPLTIIRNDITKVAAEAIVNPANNSLKKGGGVCGAIFAAAGVEKLQPACDKIGGCETGQAVLTPAYNLPAKYIIHTVGPIWRGGGAHEAERLTSCYANSLKLAHEWKCKTIAFPLISSGGYGYPKAAALQVAVAAISDFLFQHDLAVYLVAYDKEAFGLSEKLFADVRSYIDNNYVKDYLNAHPRREFEADERLRLEEAERLRRNLPRKRNLNDVVSQLDESFSQTLFRLIAEKSRTEVETYKKANIDRKLFSKIRTDKAYTPSKATALALAIALGLNLDETRDLLAKAGYTLSPSRKFDLIVEFFIEEGRYNIFEINEALFAFDQPLLGN
jgi:O-acetyl-ADP-ribose deacetylase (regulator of RNase III)